MIYKIGLILVSLMLYSDMCMAMPTQVTAPVVTQSNGIVWQDWSEEAFQQAKIKHIPVFVFVKAEWCHWCELTKDLTMHNNEVINLINSNYIPIKLDVDADVGILKQFRVTNLPTMIILDGNHHILDRFSGYISPESLIIKLTPVKKRQEGLPS